MLRPASARGSSYLAIWLMGVSYWLLYRGFGPLLGDALVLVLGALGVFALVLYVEVAGLSLATDT